MTQSHQTVDGHVRGLALLLAVGAEARRQRSYRSPPMRPVVITADRRARVMPRLVTGDLAS